MNVHKRCQKNVANNCGIDVKQLSEILADMGIRPQEPGKPSKKKVSSSAQWQMYSYYCLYTHFISKNMYTYDFMCTCLQNLCFQVFL